MPSYKNWYNWEWLEGGDTPSCSLDVWSFRPRIEAIETMSFPEAIRDALRKLQDSGKPLYLMYSGGLDSEIILREAIKMGIEIKPVFIRFADGVNEHEWYYVERFAQEFNQEIIYLDVDINAWYSDPSDFGYAGLVRKYGFVHPAAPLNFWARDQLNKLVGDCVCITGTGDLPLVKMADPRNIFSSAWYFCFTVDSQYKRLSWYKEHYPQDAPLFFAYTPELVRSFLDEPEIKDCVTREYKLSVASSRKAMYSRLWPELSERVKYTGFENVTLSVTDTFALASEYRNPITVYTNISYEEFNQLLRP